MTLPYLTKEQAWKQRLQQLGFSESDFAEQFSRSSGPGGQHVNKVSTAVTLKYLPENISVTVQDSRSQSANRLIARERLLHMILERRRGVIAAAKAERAKVRRRNSPRPRGVKEKILRNKKQRSEVKKTRGRVEH